MFRFYKIFIIILLGLSSCASDPKITVDPKSVKDMGKYQTDLKECKNIAMNFENKDAQAKSAALGAGAAVASQTAIQGKQLPQAGIVPSQLGCRRQRPL